MSKRIRHILSVYISLKRITNLKVTFRKRYICQALRAIYMQFLKYRSPFLIVSIEVDEPFMLELPDPLYVDQYEQVI